MVGGKFGEACQPVWNAPSINIETCSAHTAQPVQTPDAIAYAGQIGRLDIVSLVLGLVALAIGIGSIGGFWMIRSAAVRAAEEEARKEIRECAPEIVREFLGENPQIIAEVLRQNPEILISAAREAQTKLLGDPDGATANDIATAMEGDPNETA
ncbi:MAG: hypothetical protein RIC04_06615 [Parvibaculum sp.]|uniref:hypothetical protein n=1 Tax=Parvibaculum sp. TaxID=2024848 RepID=UPI0032EC4D00